jgi:hypothetical protein
MLEPRSRQTVRIALAVAAGAAAVLGFSCGDGEVVQKLASAPPAKAALALNAGGAGADAVDAMALDQSGNIVVAGTFAESITIAGTELTATGGRDAFVAKLTSGGVLLWAKAFGTAGSDQVGGVAVVDGHDVVVVGTFQDTLELGGGPLVSAGGSDVYAVRFDGAGTHLWSKRFGGTALDRGNRVVADGGSVIVAGEFSDTVDFDGTPLTSVGQTDAFVLRLDAATGAVAAAVGFGGTDSDAAEALLAPGGGMVAVAGTFRDELKLAASTLTSQGDNDVFLLKFRIGQ